MTTPTKRPGSGSNEHSIPTASTESTRLRRRALASALLFICAVTCGATLHAHPGHGSEISREQAIQRATAEIERLAQQDKLEKSWPVEARLKSAEMAERGSEPEWVLVFENPKAEARQSTLYVFLSLTGEYLAANFTGR